MDDEMDYPACYGLQNQDMFRSGEAGQYPFLQTTRISLSPLRYSLSPTISRELDLYSTLGNWMTPSFASQLPEPSSLQVSDDAEFWKSGAVQNLMLDSSEETDCLATDVYSYSFSNHGDGCLDSPSSIHSLANAPAGLESCLHSFDGIDGFLNHTKEHHLIPNHFTGDENYHLALLPGSNQQQWGCPGATSDLMAFAPPSPALSTSSRRSVEVQSILGSLTVASNGAIDGDDMEVRSVDSDEEGSSDPPYSTLIYQALFSAPGMKLPLQGIYSWFEKNTTKGKDQNSKGWQNSIRHNLSMNAGFEAVKEEMGAGKKSVNYWRLTEEAIKSGVQSTTRYRKQGNHKKSMKSEHPAPQRQRSGAKGGRAAKIAARMRRAKQEEQRSERYHHRRSGGTSRLQDQEGLATSGQNFSHAVTPPTPLATSFGEVYDMANVIGCAGLPPDFPIFCEHPEPGAGHFTFDVGFPDLTEINGLTNSWIQSL